MNQTIRVPFTSDELAYLRFILRREIEELEKDVQQGDLDPKDAHYEMEANTILLEKLETVAVRNRPPLTPEEEQERKAFFRFMDEAAANANLTEEEASKLVNEAIKAVRAKARAAKPQV